MMILDGYTDDEICRQFVGLVRKYAYQPHIRNVVEDAESAGWLALVQAIRDYKPETGVPFEGFAKSRVKYTLWNLYKKEKRRSEKEGGVYLVLDKPSQKHNTAQEAILNITRANLIFEISRLTERQRVALLLSYEGHGGGSAAAKALGISPQAVYNLRKRAINYLRKTLAI
jgi:RNA polymerase sigma factor (sigma-70 family)